MVFNAVQFVVYGQAKDLVRSGKELTVAEYAQAGALTGFVIAFVESPIDFFKVNAEKTTF